MLSITTLFAFSPGRLPKKDKNLLRKKQNYLNVCPWVGHLAEKPHSQSLLDLPVLTGASLDIVTCRAQALMGAPARPLQPWRWKFSTASSAQPSAHTDPLPPGAASPEELPKSIGGVQWSFPTRFGLRAGQPRPRTDCFRRDLHSW